MSITDSLSSFEVVEEAHGWRFGSTPAYPDIVCIECACGHLSVRHRDEVPEHTCPACGRASRTGGA